METFDVVIIGGGSAGYAAARTARETSEKVAIIDNSAELGGLCILRGCMPTKAMLASAHLMHDVRTAGALGLPHEGRMVADFPAIMARKDGIVEQLTDGIAAMLESHTVLAQALEGVRYDCGSRYGFIEATLDYAMDHADIRDDLLDHMAELLRKHGRG